MQDLSAIKNILLTVQKNIITMVERQADQADQADGQKFELDEWTRSEGGGGRTCVLKKGPVFDQAGVNFSHVFGNALPPSATAHRPELVGRSFQAMGVSVVIHPKNPYVPTSHFNIRYFQAEKPGEKPVGWVGGGFDLTPYYGFEEDCRDWHQIAYESVRSFGEELYPKFKKDCDEYFYLKHRKEPRGIGGLFFDDFNQLPLDKSLEMLQSITAGYIQAYEKIVARRKDRSYGDREINFQRYRRGRYVEFNLIYDRGTLFGLQSGGRTESILMSLPPEVSFKYNWHPEIGSPEAELYEKFLKPREWRL